MIEIKSIKKKFTKNDNYILDNLNFVIQKGQIVGVLGENGAGKTTLIKSILKLIQINEGKITYKKVDVNNISNKKYYGDVVAVLEGNRNLYWYLSGYDNILYSGRLKGMLDKDIKKQANEMLELFCLYEHKDKEVGVYSRGMQQKLAIIIALLGNPQILLLDEPTLGLDAKTKNEVIDNILRMVKEKQVTVFLTSHQMDVVDALADRLLLLDKGKVVFDGSPMDFKSNYSKEEYTITLVANEDDYIKKYNYKSNNGLIDILLQGINLTKAIHILNEIVLNGYNLISFHKDSASLENIMLNFYNTREEE